MPPANIDHCNRISCERVRAAAINSPAIPPASRKPAQGNSAKFVRPGSGRRYASIASGRMARLPASRISGVPMVTTIVATANSPTRTTRDSEARQSSAAAIIARPMMLRMSTFRKLLNAPHPSTCDCSRNRNASARTWTPRFSARRAASRWPMDAERSEAAIDSDRPARNRNSGAAKPATNTVIMYGTPWRSVSRVHASVTCAMTITITATPRSQSR